MSTDSTFGGMVREGDHASRPAATAVSKDTLYFCSDHGLVYRSDGATWSTFSSLGTPITEITSIPTAETDTDLVLHPDGAGGVEWAADATGGGGGAGWVQDVNLSGTTFTGWTGHSGTWSSNGTEIIQTDTSAPWKRASYGTVIPVLGLPLIFEAECQIVSNGSSPNRVGIAISAGSSDNGMSITLGDDDNTLRVDKDNSTGVASAALTITTATWYKVRILFDSGAVTVYVDGSFITNAWLIFTNGFTAQSLRFVLLSYQTSVKFRNIKAWSLTDGLPA